MADVLTPEQRRLNMSRIKGRDTKPELLLRRHLHAAGFRYRLHAAELPGRPDIVLPKYGAVIFVHGCFWHGHDCPLFKLPSTRREFWAAKIIGNSKRDQAAIAALQTTGWRTLTVWECSLRGPARRSIQDVVESMASFLVGNLVDQSLSGTHSVARKANTEPKFLPSKHVSALPDL